MRTAPDVDADGAPDIRANREAFVRELWDEWRLISGQTKEPTSTEYSLMCRWFQSGVRLRWACSAISETWRREVGKGNRIKSLTYFDGAVIDEAKRVLRGQTV